VGRNQCIQSGHKIALFYSLFRGWGDVFPKRWENPRTGKAGYAPACANVIDGHLRGHHTVGV
jgi:hypothetical protein